MFCFVFVATERENSGECWFSRPSELDSPKRDYQVLAQNLPLKLSPRRLVIFLSEGCSHLGEKGLAWARRGSPERDPAEPPVPSLRPRLGELGFAWARGSLSPERALLAWARQRESFDVVVKFIGVWLAYLTQMLY